MDDIKSLKKEIELLKQRNLKVDENKAWEMSITRRMSLIFTTYIVISLTLFTIGNDRPLVNAIIPSIGFYLSTLSLPYIKDWWKKNVYKKSDKPE